MHHHAQTVAHQHDVDMGIQQPCRMRMITGEADDGLGTFVGADFGNRDALELGLDGHGVLLCGRWLYRKGEFCG